MNHPSVLRWIGFGLSLVAIAFALQLVSMHAKGTSDPGLLGKLCGPESAGCDKVISSRYGYFPFAPAEASGDALRKGRIPVAALGLFYYTFLAVYFGLIGQPSWPVRRLHTVILGVVGLGIIGSLSFLGIMWGAIGDTCLLCLTTHVCNFAIAFVVWKLRPTEPKFPEEGGGLVKPVLPFPDTKLGVTAALLVLALCAAEWFSYRATYEHAQVGGYAAAAEELTAFQEEFEQYAAAAAENETLKTRIAALERQLQSAGPATDADVIAMREELAELREENEALRERIALLEEIAGDVEVLDAAFMEQDQLQIPIRDDDPKIPAVSYYDPEKKRNRTGFYMQVVVYGDPECPNCHKFHNFLKDDLIPAFKGHIEVVYKHYIGKEHAEGLKGAKALEAARLQGNEFFWRMNDYLHERFETLGSVDYTAAAQEIGLDLQRFIADMGSPAVAERLNQDMRDAVNILKIPGTPAVYLNKRPVSRAVRTNIGFWKIHASKLQGTRERVGQPW